MAMVLSQSRLRVTQAKFFGNPQASGGAGFVRRDGSTTLTNNWNAGNFRIDSQNSTRVFNVRAFGAVGNGVTDDRIAIDNALAAAAANDGFGVTGGTVWFPKGAYSRSTTLVVPDRVSLAGEGKLASLIYYTGMGDAVQYVGVANTVTGRHSTIRDIGVAGFNVGNVGAGFALGQTAFVSIQNVYVQGMKYGVILDQAETCSVANSVFTQMRAGGAAFWLTDAAQRTPGAIPGFTNSNIIDGNQIDAGATANGMFHDGYANNRISSNNFNGGGGGIGFRCANSAGLILENNAFETYTTNDILFTNTYSDGSANPGTSTVHKFNENISATIAANSCSSAAMAYPVSLDYMVGGSFENNGFGNSPGTADFTIGQHTTQLRVGGNSKLTTGASRVSTPFTDISQAIKDAQYYDQAGQTYVNLGAIAPGVNTVTPASMEGIVVGERLSVSNADGTNQENVIVTGTSPTTFTATFASAKANEWVVYIAPSVALGVDLQVASPGVSQLGNANISGTGIFGGVGIGATPTRTLDLTGVQRIRGIAAPAVSEANSATIYFDSASNTLKASLNGSAYVNVIGSGGVSGTGQVGRVAYWDAVNDVAAPSDVYIDAVNNRVGIKTAVPVYELDVTGDINLASGANSIRIGGDQVLRASGSSLSLGRFTGATALSTSIGANALFADVAGSKNTAVGSLACINSATGSNNTGVGHSCLNAMTVGAFNTAIGDTAGGSNVSGNQNVFVGASADAAAGNLSNAVAIGANAVVGASNSMQLGNATMQVGIRTGGTPKHALDVGGSVANRETALVLIAGLNSDIAITDFSWQRITGPAAPFSIGGFAGGTDGQILCVYNTTVQNMTVVHESVGSAAINRINCLNAGADVPLAGPCAFTFRYDDTDDRWILVNFSHV